MGNKKTKSKYFVTEMDSGSQSWVSRKDNKYKAYNTYSADTHYVSIRANTPKEGDVVLEAEPGSIRVVLPIYILDDLENIIRVIRLEDKYLLGPDSSPLFKLDKKLG